MDRSIISISGLGILGMLSLHPFIKAIMHKQIGKHHISTQSKTITHAINEKSIQHINHAKKAFQS